MRTYKTNSISKITVFVSLAFLILCTHCDPTKPLKNKKTIVTLYGEVAKSSAQIEDPIIYKIYYANLTNNISNIAIIDTLERGIRFVRASDGGSYDPGNRVVSWIIPNVPANSHGFVTISAVIKGAGILSNKAVIYSSATELRNIKDFQETGRLSTGRGRTKITKIITNVVTTQVCKQPKLGWLPFYRNSKENEIVTGTIKDETTTDIMVHFDVPGMLVNQVHHEGVAFHKITLPGNAWMTEIGKPELPIVGRMIEVPKDVSISVKIVKEDTLSFPCYNIYPAQYPAPDKNIVVDTFVQDILYGQDIIFPEVPSIIRDEDYAVMRGHRLLFLKVSPFQYNPATKRLKVYRKIEVKLEYNKPSQVEPIDRRLYSEEYEKVLKEMLLNFKDQYRLLDGTSTDTYNDDNDDKPGRGCDYLIISANNYYNANDNNNPIVRLARWKEQKGFVTWVRTISDITGGNTANSIETFIQNAYDTWSPPPTYVLLVGDADEVATNYQTQHSEHNNTLNGTDLYYSTTDGTDYFPDLFIGRLSVENANQLEDVVDKIIDYEQNPPNNAAFYTDAQLIALFEDDTDFAGDTDPEDGTEDRPWIENVEEIFDYLDNNGYNPERIYASSSGWPADPASSQPANFQDGGLIQPPDIRVANGFGWDGDGNDISNGINNGRFLVTYRDHGSRTGWSGFIGFNNNDADNLTNGNLAPVVLSFACENGWFDNETDAAGLNTGLNAESFCEHFHRNANGGAVAIFGATRISWTGLNDFLMFGFHKAIWSDFVPNPPITGYPAIPDRESTTLFEMGQIHSFAKCYMANAYTHSNSREMTFEMYHLFGDPEMSIWTERPARLKVDHPDGVGSTGIQDFIVNVEDNTNGNPVGMATVSLTRGDDILKVLQTNPNGDARFTLSSLGAGDFDITVVKDNFVPYMGTITMVNNGAQINRLDVDNNIAGSDVLIGGKDFDSNEQVEIYFDGTVLKTVTANGGAFGQSGGTDVKITIPNNQEIGYYTVLAKGKSSGKYAVDVLIVRKANPIDLFTYSQWDNTTWHLHSGSNPTWNNPEIQLYDASNNQVASNNLVAGQTYTIKIKVHNTTNFHANNAVVTFKYANFGVGQPDRVWQLIGDATVNIPASTTREAEIKWTTPGTGHLCVKGDIYHIEDINTENNGGQENCHVGPTSSPAIIPFTVWNPTRKPAMVYFELRQIGECDKEDDEWKYWASWIIHPDPQLIQPGDSATVKVTIDPDLFGNKIRPGECVEFALTGYIGEKVVGGVNFDITKK